MRIGEFRLQLYALTERARKAALPATEVVVALTDAIEAFRGAIIHEQLERGTWPPDEHWHSNK
jgi:hypothetical protein